MFKDGDVICFFGDSITASGLWEAEVYQVLKKKYNIKCYNCGVSGGTADRGAGYLYSECLIRNPQYVVLMFGMNDLERPAYEENVAKSPETQEKREKAMSLHKESYEEIIKNCLDFGANVILCLPTPYDEVSENATQKLFFQQALEEASKFHLELSEKYGLKVVNFKDIMLSLLAKKAIIKEDRIHPTEEGYHVMAQTFLKETGIISETDFNAPFVFEDWNKDRYDWEQKNHTLNYVELCATYYDGYMKNKSVEEIKKLAKQKYDDLTDKEGFVATALLTYIEKGHLRPYIKGEVVKRTI